MRVKQSRYVRICFHQRDTIGVMKQPRNERSRMHVRTERKGRR